ncbi:hypothetical protein Tco_1043757 [Tanacetum coccineum]|uniref:Uncharacterized protein n=1 Tax=Tanacetum coccineum TaxID=301880 RepID=A0ABQ5GQ47_9ASTR
MNPAMNLFSMNGFWIVTMLRKSAREIGDPYSRRLDEYNRVFKNEIEHLSNEYILRIGKKGYILDDVWEKCQQNYKKTNEAWHDEAYEEDEMWRIGNGKTNYDPPYVNIETFEVKNYSFKGGSSFICITDRENEALLLGRINGARFKAMIRKELEVHKIQKLGGNYRDRSTHIHLVTLLNLQQLRRNHYSYAVTAKVMT